MPSEEELKEILARNPALRVAKETNIEKLVSPVAPVAETPLPFMTEGRSVRIVLPYPPGTNNLFPQNKQGRRFPSKRYKEWKKAAKEKIKGQATQLLNGKLAITMRFYRPQKSGDWDGFIKAPQDFLHGICFTDDKSIVEGHIYRYDDKFNPRVEIEIKEIF